MEHITLWQENIFVEKMYVNNPEYLYLYGIMDSDLFTSILRRLFANFDMRSKDIEEGIDDFETEGLPSDMEDMV